MRFGGDIWSLPGPGAYVGEIAILIAGGQHVAAVLPRYLARDPDRGDSLAVAVLDRIHAGRRIQPWPTDGPLVEAIGRQVTFDDDPPVTVPDLIQHRDVVGQVLVCLASELSEEHQVELPDFLRRLAVDSMSIAAERRCIFVLILDRSLLPRLAGGERSEVTLANSWYWNRTSRWDIAAWLASVDAIEPNTPGVLHEVRTETVIELARWNFDLGTQLMQSWTGDPSALLALCADASNASPCVDASTAAGPVSLRPPETLLDAWDEAMVDGWHDAMALAPSLLLHDRIALNRFLWAAQARVLLPWIEVRRDRLEGQLAEFMGRERFGRAVRGFAGPGYDPRDPDSVAEVGLLNVVAQARVGAANPRLRDAARVLRNSRNHLAHLRPLPPAMLEELVRTGDLR